MTHDLYKLKLNSDNQLKRVNSFGKPRLTSASCGTSLKLYGNKKSYNNNIFLLAYYLPITNY